MTRPTAEKKIKMQYKKIVKEIWETELGRDKADLTSVYLEKPFMKIKTAEKEIDIHPNLFKDYITATDDELKISSMQKIKERLAQLL